MGVGFLLFALALSILLATMAWNAMRRSEEHLRAFVESGASKVIIFDRHEVLTYVGSSLQKHLGYQPDELLGRGAVTLIHPDDAGHVREMIQAMFSAPGEVVHLEFRILAAEGSWRLFQGLGNTLSRDSADSGVIVRMRDTTAQKEAERFGEIAERERREKTALLESTSEGIYGVDLLGRCTFVNPAAQRMLGFSAGECMGQNMHELIHHSWPDGTPYPEVDCVIFQAFRAGRNVRSENEVLWRKDGTVFPASCSSSPIVEAGIVQGAVITFGDITVQKEAEEALRRAKREAEDANRAKSDFLSRMSHELRTPMNSILGFGQLLARHEQSEDRRRSIDHILKAGRHLLQLINEVLDLARIEANRQPLSIEAVKAGPVVQEVIGLIRPLADQYGCMLVETRTESDDLHVRADRQRLTQVLLNLLSNAIKYNRPGGSVTVWCESADEPDDRSGEEGWLRFNVHDTGRGIPPERLGDLFVPFSRLGAEQTDVEGTGLGLALSQRLVEAMGGTLSVESVVGEGSTFCVTLPRIQSPLARWAEATSGMVEPPMPEPSIRPSTILYIEDNLANFSLIEAILAEHPNVRLIPALQGRLGLDLAAEHLPDLVLLDLHLPDTSGEEVLRQLRNDPRTRHIPVLVISADATPSRIEQLRAAGAEGYITKPLDVDGFLAAIRGALRTDRSDLKAAEQAGT